jgi:acyl-CoA thioesterase
MDVDLNQLNQIREFFSADRYAAHSGIEIESAEDGTAECGMEIRAYHLNAGDAVHGGAIFMLGDFALAVAANARLALGDPIGVTVSQSANISYFRPPKGRRLIARAERVSRGRTISVYRMTIFDDLGTSVAEMRANVYQIGRDAGV